MIDLFGDVLRAATSHSSAAYPLAFGAGLVTSLGPCSAPRYIAVAALAHNARRPAFVVVGFAAGVVGAYGVLGSAAGALGALTSASGLTYAILAIVLASGAVVTLARAGGEHAADHACGTMRSDASIGAVMLLGAVSALVISPCCTPLAAAIAGLSLPGENLGGTTALLSVFALGHVAPIVVAGSAAARISPIVRRLAASQAPAIISGSLMLALAAYYGLLA